MPENGLTSFIIQYINERKRPKREALEKEEAKALAETESPEQRVTVENDFTHRYAELEEKYQPANWLSDAARRAGQISLVTHAIKFTHSDAKGTSIYSQPDGTDDPLYLSTASIKNPVLDAVGNAAALDVVRLLQTEYQGDSLIASLIRGDTSALAVLAENGQQLDEWVTGLKQVLSSLEPASHKLSKQIYFPTDDGQYHLVSPLFSSSLAHVLHERLVTARYSEQAKEVYAAFKGNTWHAQPRVIYPNTAVQNFGGTKPQNISYLNSVRGGKTRLLSCAPPVWQSAGKPPMQYKSVFNSGSEFSSLARTSVIALQRYLQSVYRSDNSSEVRQRRLAYIDEIIDILFNYVAGIHHQEAWAGWTEDEACELKRSQRLWLDPLRCRVDEDFKRQREVGDWKKEVARDFGYWLSQQIGSGQLNMGEVEQRYFSTVPLFKRRLRELEKDVSEVLL